MSSWIDTHCHLDAAEFAADRDTVREQAAAAGVAHCVIPAVERANWDAVRQLAHRHGDSYALGIHPLYTARAADADIFIGVAAVADYRVANAAEHKLKKDTGGIPPIELVENPDILAEVAALKDGPFCVGFAAESQNLEAYAQTKRRKKNIPLIAGNLIQDGFGGDDNRLVLFDDAGTHPLAPAPKSVLARQLVEHIAQLLTGKD